MWMKTKISECDMTGEYFDEPVDGIGALAQGATGRVCVVLWASMDYAKEHGITPLSYEEAEQYAESLGGWLDA